MYAQFPISKFPIFLSRFTHEPFIVTGVSYFAKSFSFMFNQLSAYHKYIRTITLVVLFGVVLSSTNVGFYWKMDMDSEPVEQSNTEDNKSESEEDKTEEDPDDKLRDLINGLCFMSSDSAKKELLFTHHHSVFHPEIQTPPPKDEA